MNNNLTILVGFPNVGKSTITKKLSTLEDVVIFQEDEVFVELLNNLMTDWPNFSNYAEFREWRIEHREETKFLFDVDSEITMESLYQDAIKHVQDLALQSPDKKYILDMGGYAYTRGLDPRNVVYLKYPSIEDFYTRFKQRYNDGNGNLFVPAVPTVLRERIELNETNYEGFYKVGDKLFEKMSSLSIVNNEHCVEETAKEVIKFIENNFNKTNKSKPKKPKGKHP